MKATYRIVIRAQQVRVDFLMHCHARHRHAGFHALMDQLMFDLRVMPAPTIALVPNHQSTQYL
jgi:hypothetical protein